MERTTDGKVVMSFVGTRVAQTHDGDLVLRPPLIPLIMASHAVLWFLQFVVMLVMYASRILAVLLLLGAMLHLSAPSMYAVVWLGYVCLALLVAYACRQLVSRLKTKRGKF